jgi:hypothetical protein
MKFCELSESTSMHVKWHRSRLEVRMEIAFPFKSSLSIQAEQIHIRAASEWFPPPETDSWRIISEPFISKSDSLHFSQKLSSGNFPAFFPPIFWPR